MVGTGILPNNMTSPSPECYTTFWMMTTYSDSTLTGHYTNFWPLLIMTLLPNLTFYLIVHPHRVWALWWQGGKKRLRTSRCPCRCRLGTLKTPSCPWRGCPAAGQNLETGHLSRHYSWNIAECDVKPQSTINNNINNLIVQGFHRTYATGAAWQQRSLSPPDIWSVPLWDLHVF